MSLSRKISQIKDLKSLQPDKRWEATTKFDLLAEISSQNRLMQAQKLDRKEKLDLFGSRLLNRLAPSFSKAVAVFLIIVMGSSISYAAQASVPGQALWPIKRSIEKAELVLTFSPIREAEIHMNHAQERLNEIDRILESDNSTPDKQEQKEKAIKQAVTHLTKDVAAADSSLKVAKEEKKPLEVVELAKRVADASKKVDSNLKQKKIVAAADKNIEDALNSAQAANKIAKDSAVAVALEVHDSLSAASKNATDSNDQSDNGMDNETTTEAFLASNSSDKSTLDNQEAESVKNLVKEIIASEINDTTDEVAGVKQKAEDVSSQDIDNIKKDNADINQATDELKSITVDDSEEVDQTLDEAKGLLEDGFLRNAYEKISQVKEKYQRAEDVLKEIQEAIDNHNTIDSSLLDMSEDNDTNQGNTNVEPKETSVAPQSSTDLQASAIKQEPILDTTADREVK